MIDRLSHVTLWVTDQDEALKFYTEKLGFVVRTDATMDGFRWLTVSPKDQPEPEIVLVQPSQGPMMDQETADAIQTLIGKGAMGGGVFYTKDCKATYEELKAKGVEFIAPPQERPYGVEAIIKDNSGNWFSLNQPAEWQGE